MHVYQSGRFLEQVERFRLGDRLLGFLAALEEHPDVHPPPGLIDQVGPYWKRRVGKFRVVGRPLRVEGLPVVCMLEVFERKDPAYSKFLDDPKEFGESQWARHVDDGEIAKWLSSREGLIQQVIPLQPLPADLAPWLEPPKWVGDVGVHDVVIYESEEWIARFRRREIQDYWTTYHELVLGALDEEAPREISGWPGVFTLEHDSGRGVTYSRFQTDTGREALLLLAPTPTRPSNEELEVLITRAHPAYWEQDPLNPEAIQMDDLARFARRSYPDFVLYDQDVWLDIERETEANLALSAEEEQVLQSVSAGSNEGATLPIFINGRAGSGKSTMLLHLFAEFCHRKEQENLAGEPLFLTYNERLLQVAREGVRSLVSSHHRFLAARGGTDQAPQVDAFFQPFQKFLLGLLPASERGRFAPDKHIGFHSFKVLYGGKDGTRGKGERALQLPQAKSFSPEMCWHAIRSFIKGYNIGQLVDPSAYEEIPRRDRSIADDAFKQIFDTIWSQWYEPLTTDHGYWDDQDLVRRVLELEAYSPSYTAIVCDEAQDFTRIELQLIMRLSLLSQYDLSKEVVHCLPFAFAGDPSQTLNPTGFRWASLRASFYDEVIRAMDASREWNLSMNLQDLIYNYRSKGPIVHIINVIQMWRHVLFRLTELRPQLAWAKGDFPEPQKFILGKNLTSEELGSRAADTIILVPCEEGQEGEFVQEDPVLKQMVSLADGTTPKNVLSAPSAKGLEFQRVILYKFGEACPDDPWTTGPHSERQRLESEYFFNKLYVAASRAMTRLFIVDSPEGDSKLWSRAASRDVLEKDLARTEGSTEWTENVAPLTLGTSDTLLEMGEDDPNSIAVELKKKGRALRSPAHLRRARAYFAMLGKHEEAAWCEASALVCEEEFETAGRKFSEHGFTSEAGEAFWAGLNWEDLHQWHQDNPGSEIDGAEGAALPMSVFMLAGANDVDAIREFLTKVEAIVAAPTFGERALRQWRTVSGMLSSRLGGLRADSMPTADWSLGGKILERLARSGYLDSTQNAGEAYFRATNFHKAVECWEAAAETSGQDYFLAKAATVPYPEKLLWLDRARDPDRVIEEWEKAGTDRTERRFLRLVATALSVKGRHLEAFRIHHTIRDTEKMIQALANASPVASDSDLFDALLVLTESLVAVGEWNLLAGSIREYWSRVDQTGETYRTRLILLLAGELGQSELTPDEIAEDTREVFAGILEEAGKTSEWRRRIPFPEMAAAFERVGHLVSALRFYERYFNDVQPSVKSLARERWLVVKKRQIDTARDDAAKERITRERANRRYDWSIPEKHLESLPAFPPTTSVGPGVDVEGLPPDFPLERLRDGDVRFHLDSVEVRTFRRAARLNLTDERSGDVTRIDLRTAELEGPIEAVTGPRSGAVTFKAGSDFEGQIHAGPDHCSVILAASGLEVRLEIMLTG